MYVFLVVCLCRQCENFVYPSFCARHIDGTEFRPRCAIKGIIYLIYFIGIVVVGQSAFYFDICKSRSIDFGLPIVCAYCSVAFPVYTGISAFILSVCITFVEPTISIPIDVPQNKLVGIIVSCIEVV